MKIARMEPIRPVACALGNRKSLLRQKPTQGEKTQGVGAGVGRGVLGGPTPPVGLGTGVAVATGVEVGPGVTLGPGVEVGPGVTLGFGVEVGSGLGVGSAGTPGSMSCFR